jgi:hypothetical protein
MLNVGKISTARQGHVYFINNIREQCYSQEGYFLLRKGKTASLGI